MKKSKFFILEAGVNHEGDLKAAIEIVKAAAKTGADAIKFQTYTAERIAAIDSPSYWDTKEEPTSNQRDLFKKFDKLSVDDYFKLHQICVASGIEFMTTCFDEEWVDLLDPILQRYKVASADITNFPLLRKVASKNKPILLSTGAASISEVLDAISCINSKTNHQITLMHCVLNYPTLQENASLSRIKILEQNFPGFQIGYSDHTKVLTSEDAIYASYILGARVIEKHFTLTPEKPGNDHYHSLDPESATKLISRLDSIEKMMDFNEKEFLESQADARRYARRGLYASRDIVAGETFTLNDLIALRPTFLNGFNPNQVSEEGKFTAKLSIGIDSAITKENAIYSQVGDLP